MNSRSDQVILDRQQEDGGQTTATTLLARTSHSDMDNELDVMPHSQPHGLDLQKLGFVFFFRRF